MAARHSKQCFTFLNIKRKCSNMKRALYGNLLPSMCSCSVCIDVLFSLGLEGLSKISKAQVGHK